MADADSLVAEEASADWAAFSDISPEVIAGGKGVGQLLFFRGHLGGEIGLPSFIDRFEVGLDTFQMLIHRMVVEFGQFLAGVMLEGPQRFREV